MINWADVNDEEKTNEEVVSHIIVVPGLEKIIKNKINSFNHFNKEWNHVSNWKRKNKKQNNVKENGDKVIECKWCKQEFIYTRSQQYWYEKQGWVPPVRCLQCRKDRKKKWESKNQKNETKTSEMSAQISHESQINIDI